TGFPTPASGLRRDPSIVPMKGAMDGSRLNPEAGVGKLVVPPLVDADLLHRLDHAGRLVPNIDSDRRHWRPGKMLQHLLGDAHRLAERSEVLGLRPYHDLVIARDHRQLTVPDLMRCHRIQGHVNLNG